MNFSGPSQPLQLQQMKFAFNNTGDQGFTDAAVRGINRPTDLKFGLHGCAYCVDFGAVRDFGQSDPATAFQGGAANAPLVQIPFNGVIWKICSAQPSSGGDDDNEQ